MISQNKSLTILMVAPQPWFQPRGTPFSVLHRIKALSLLGHKVDLVTYPIGADVAIENLTIHRAARIPFVKNVKIGPSKTKLVLDVGLYFKFRQMIRQNSYDLVHSHEEAFFFALPEAKRRGLPHLYDMHSSLPQQLRNFKFTRSKLLFALFERMERFALQNSNAIITICPELQNYVTAGFPQTTSILIENVADNSLVFPATSSQEAHLRQEFGMQNKKVVLYYGTLEPYQGIDLLIDSAVSVIGRKDDSVHFLIAGGHDSQVLSYQKKVAEKGLERHFSFTGFVQPQVIPNLVAMSDVLVSPRLKGTNSPLKIYSYLRSGKPIVATRHITHTQVLNDSVAVLTDLTPEAFAQGILQIFEQPQNATRLVVSAQKLAEQHYSYQDYLQKTQWILDRAMGGNG